MKISIIFLQIYLLSVACSPNLDYRVNAPMGVAVESNSAEEGNIGSIGGMKVLYPKDSYTVSGSTYSDTTTATINGVPAQSYAGPNGEIVVLIPENLKNGRLNIEVSNSNDSLKIDNVFHLNDPSIPLFSGSASLMCSSTQFYNANGDLTTGTKFCASDDSNFKAENIKVGISVAGVTGTYAGPPLAPSNLVSRAMSLTQIDHSWDVVTSDTSYLLIMNEGSPVSFVPTDGVSYSPISQTGGNIIYSGIGTFHSQTSGIVANSRYYYALYAYDGSDYSLMASPSVVSTLDCSDTTNGEWIRVPGNVAYEGRDFCVMKYEAKDVASAPKSNASGTPWVSTSQTTATTACDSIGAQLITNDQWMTIATNIANQGNNWDGGIVGTGALYAGHNDNLPSNALEASSNDSYQCFETVDGSTTTCTGGSGEQRRTHTLSNGEVIWDMAGNAWEWTSYVISDNNDKPSGSGGDSWSQYDSVNGTASMVKSELISNSWTSTQGVGQYYRGSQNSGGALRRGGTYYNVPSAGVFAANLLYDSAPPLTDTGFRCVRLDP